MKRLAVAIVIAVCGVLWARGPRQQAAPWTGAEQAHDLGSQPAIDPRGGPPGAGPESPEWQRRHLALVRRVQERCGLDIRSSCGDDTCIALTLAPNLDHLSGWATLGLSSPHFVLAAAAREIGLPARLACEDAIASLVHDQDVPSVPLPDGRDLWCTGRGPAAWTASDLQAACDVAANGIPGLEPAPFASGTVRLLQFRR